MSVFRAVVTAPGHPPIEVEYPADSQHPTQDAVKLAAKKLGLPCFAQEPRVTHFRDEVKPDGDG